MTAVTYKLFDFLNYNGLESKSRRAVADRKRKMPTTPEHACAEALASAYLPEHPTRDDVLRVLRIAYLEGCTATLISTQRMLGAAPVAVEFPILDRDSDRHVRVITGTGNGSERRELDALCRALGPQP